MSVSRNIGQFLRTTSFGRTLRHRDYTLLETIGWFSIAGVWFYRVGLGLLTWELTHSGAWLGFIALAEAAPAILLSPLAGAYADRFDRLVMGRFIQILMVLQTGALAILTILDLNTIWILLGFSVAHGMIGAFWAPVRHAIVANVVPREDITPAVAIHSMLFNVARFLGPALAGPVIAIWGIGWAFAITAVGYLGYLIVLFMINLRYPDERNERKQSLTRDMKDGLVYAFTHPALKHLFLIVIAASVFLRAYFELLAGISADMFGQGPEGFATLVSVTGFGAIGGAIWISFLGSIRRIFTAFILAVALALIMHVVFAATQVFWVGLAAAMVLGFTITAMNIAAQVMFQSGVRGAMRGRVMSLWSIIARAGPAIGAVIVGEAATWLGFQIPLLGAAVFTAFVGAYVFARRGEIAAELERETAPAPAEGTKDGHAPTAAMEKRPAE